jgi:hypothetical protein
LKREAEFFWPITPLHTKEGARGTMWLGTAGFDGGGLPFHFVAGPITGCLEATHVQPRPQDAFAA